MSGFSRRLYALVRQIPPGQVATYGQLALLLGNPRMSRAVGTALSACRDDSVPCHRVVSRLLLELEAVPFTPEGYVDLSRCLWPGPA